MGTDQVQDNLSVQTMQTSIWTTGSTSKGRRRGRGRWDLQKCDYPIQGRAVNCKITQSTHNPWMSDPVVQIEVCTVCTERLVRT